jgi:hypothetical protein
MGEVVLQDYRQIVLSNATVTTSGSAIFDGFGAKELSLIINNTIAPTGTTPTITFSIQEVDPGNLTTLLGNSVSGTAISTATTQIVSLPMMYTGTVQVTWTITGTTPSFTGLYASLISKVAGTVSLFSEGGVTAMGVAGTPGATAVTIQGISGGQSVPISGTVTATNPSVGTNGAVAPTSSTQTGGIYDITPVAPANGQIEAFQIDQSGNLLTFAGIEVITGAAWTSATGLNTLQYQTGTTTIGQLLGASAVLVQLDMTTTLTGGAVTIQGTYDGINWVTVPAAQVLNPQTSAQIANPYSFVASAQTPILVLLQGFLAIRLNLTTVITGSGTVTPYWSTRSISPLITLQGPGTAGTNEGGVLSVQGVAGGTALPVSFTPATDRTSTGTITTTQNVAVSTLGEANVGITITGTWAGTLSFQGSIDGTNYVPVLAYSTLTAAPVTSTTAAVSGTSGDGQWTIPCTGYADIRVIGATVTSGTATVWLDAGDASITAMAVAAGGFAAAGLAVVGNPVLVGPVTDNNLVGALAFGEAYRLRTGQESLAFLDNFDGSTVNTVKWTQSTLTMTQAQTQTSFNMNSGGNHTTSTYSILTSTKAFMVTGEFGIETRIKAILTPQTNAVIELGFIACATTSAPTNGVFFRITSAGVQELVINFNGTEVASTIATAMTAADNYTFVVYMYGTTARLDILNFDNSLFATTTLQAPATQGALVQLGHIPVAMRVYDTGTAPGAAANIVATSVSVTQMDLAANKAWEVQLGDMARFANSDPLTGLQLTTYANSSAPATTAAASLSNTAAAASTLGGLFAFNPPASGETDYILFAYQVPANFDLLIWSVTIDAALLAVQSSSNPLVYQWGLAVGSSAVSLATAGANPPLRQSLGIQTSPKSASIGDPLSPGKLIWAPRAPVVCYGGKYVHIFVRCISSNLTVGQIIRGAVAFDAVFQ